MKNILVLGIGNETWLGGVVYVHNMLFQISQIEDIENKFKIHLLIPKDSRRFYAKIEWSYVNQIIGDLSKENIMDVCIREEIDVVFPVINPNELWMLDGIILSWIPDFQEMHLPQFFDNTQIRERAYRNTFCALKGIPLILSSCNALNDYKKSYPNYANDVFVVPFVSYIKHELEDIDLDYRNSVIKKYGIAKRYVYIANQFWQHKNYWTAFKAIRELVKNRKLDIQLVCTGNMNSYGKVKEEKHDDYSAKLINYIKQEDLQNHIKLLGVIGRTEQLAIMIGATCVIQPSLFEGWGCTVEDAKSIGKRIILSDIAVHREQMNSMCRLFSAKEENSLADAIEKEFQNEEGLGESENSDMAGWSFCQEKSREYAKKLEIAFNAVKSRKTDYKKRLHDASVEIIKKCVEDFKGNSIGIYGIGKHTDNMLPILRECYSLQDIYFFDGDKNKQGKQYNGKKVYSPEDIGKIGISDIIVSSRIYQDDILNSMHVDYNKVLIHTLYNTEEERMLRLFD